MANAPRFASGNAPKDAAAATPKGTKQPQAYIFIGHDKFRNETRTPQEWRKLFVVLARMAEEYDKTVKQNVFGLGIVYDALEAYEKEAMEALGADYESEVERHWKDALAEDAKRAEQRAIRAKEKATATGESTDEEDAEEEGEEAVEPATKVATPTRRK